MKLKRAKAYRKNIKQFEIQFGFREPYQVLVDHDIVQDAFRSKIDLVSRLEGVLHGKIKILITQCAMRHLYATKQQDLISYAKEFERRRCGHHELESALSDLECLSAVVDPKGSLTNKHRYVVASQDREVRAHMRSIPGVPLVYISKSVMIMEPMSAATADQRSQEERSKFRAGLKGQRNPDPPKRKRDDDDDGQGADNEVDQEAKPQKKRKRRGPKEPNPLSVKKPKKAADAPAKSISTKPKQHSSQSGEPAGATESTGPTSEESQPRKRRRRHKPKEEGEFAARPDGEVATT